MFDNEEDDSKNTIILNRHSYRLLIEQPTNQLTPVNPLSIMMTFKFEYNNQKVVDGGLVATDWIL